MMWVFVVLVSINQCNIEPWGVYSTSAAAVNAQEECRMVYRFATPKVGSIYGLETCEIWQYRLDGQSPQYFPRPEPGLPLPEHYDEPGT